MQFVFCSVFYLKRVGPRNSTLIFLFFCIIASFILTL